MMGVIVVPPDGSVEVYNQLKGTGDNYPTEVSIRGGYLGSVTTVRFVLRNLAVSTISLGLNDPYLAKATRVEKPRSYQNDFLKKKQGKSYGK